MSFGISSAIIGGAYTVLGTTSFSLNIFLLFVLWRGEFLRSKPSNSSIYLLAFANVFGSVIQVSIIAFYVGPICFLQTYLFDGGVKSFENHLLSYIQLGQWYQDMQITAIVAINRLVVIVFRNDNIFTRPVVKTLSIMVFPTGFLLAIVSQTIIPCCVPYYNYEVYWMQFVDNGTNMVDEIIDLPQNSISSLVSIVCYTTIFIYFKIYNNKHTLVKTASEVKQNREVRLACQFAALSAFILFAWIGFRIFPLVLPNSINELKSSVGFAIILHCSANTIIFFTMNREVKIFRVFMYFGN